MRRPQSLRDSPWRCETGSFKGRPGIGSDHVVLPDGDKQKRDHSKRQVGALLVETNYKRNQSQRNGDKTKEVTDMPILPDKPVFNAYQDRNGQNQNEKSRKAALLGAQEHQRDSEKNQCLSSS